VSNGYTAVPAIIPGPLTVNGLLTVNSDLGIRIGGSAPFVRVYKRSVGSLGVSYNLGTDEATRDNAAQIALAIAGLTVTPNGGIIQVNAAGTQKTTLFDTTVAQNGTVVAHTGTTTEDTIYSVVIPANTLGVDGALIVEVHVQVVAQGAVNTAFRVKLGTGIIAQYLTTVVQSRQIRAVMQNANSAIAQKAWGFSIDNAANLLLSDNTPAVDTTVDQTLSFTIQNGTATDSQNVRGWRVHAFVGAFAPL
jgi:hypothetical protein